jgi:hypothetical protein
MSTLPLGLLDPTVVCQPSRRFRQRQPNPPDKDRAGGGDVAFDLSKIFAENLNRPLMRGWVLEGTAHRRADEFDRAIDLPITRLRRRSKSTPPIPRRSHGARNRLMFVPPKQIFERAALLRLPLCSAILLG